MATLFVVAIIYPLITQNISSKENPSSLPDFSAFTDTKQKKHEFFEFLAPIVSSVNADIKALREKVVVIQKQSKAATEYTVKKKDKKFLLKLSEDYNIKADDAIDDAFFNALLLRIDQVPPSLAMAQAANESAWGTSRFAREANNLFGQWCFTPGCGLVPKARAQGKTHEVASFASVRDSVKAYIHNINSGRAYQKLRNIRAKSTDIKFKGVILATGLLRYSSRGAEYVQEIQQMIKSNQLASYDLPKLNQNGQPKK